jgi:hypothetical protein
MNNYKFVSWTFPIAIPAAESRLFVAIPAQPAALQIPAAAPRLRTGLKREFHPFSQPPSGREDNVSLPATLTFGHYGGSN